MQQRNLQLFRRADGLRKRVFEYDVGRTKLRSLRDGLRSRACLFTRRVRGELRCWSNAVREQLRRCTDGPSALRRLRPALRSRSVVRFRSVQLCWRANSVQRILYRHELRSGELRRLRNQLRDCRLHERNL